MSNCKPLTQEQSEAIANWLLTNYTHKMEQAFIEKFPPSCCDDCANGDTCKGEVIREADESPESYMARLKKAGKTTESEVQEILSRNESEFDSNIITINVP